MITLGVILLVIGFLASAGAVWTAGAVLLVAGVILAGLGLSGRAVGGRAHYF